MIFVNDNTKFVLKIFLFLHHRGVFEDGCVPQQLTALKFEGPVGHSR
jgi:hypothetical protein